MQRPRPQNGRAAFAGAKPPAPHAERQCDRPAPTSAQPTLFRDEKFPFSGYDRIVSDETPVAIAEDRAFEAARSFPAEPERKPSGFRRPSETLTRSAPGSPRAHKKGAPHNGRALKGSVADSAQNDFFSSTNMKRPMMS